MLKAALKGRYFKLEESIRNVRTKRNLIKKKLIQSAHDISEGGLFVALIESAIQRDLGFDVTRITQIRKDSFWFGEGQGRIVVSVSPDKLDSFEKEMQNSDTTFRKIGDVTLERVIVEGEEMSSIRDWKQIYMNPIEQKLYHSYK